MIASNDPSTFHLLETVSDSKGRDTDLPTDILGTNTASVLLEEMENLPIPVIQFGRTHVYAHSTHSSTELQPMKADFLFQSELLLDCFPLLTALSLLQLLR